MGAAPRLSIGLPVYDGAEFLGQSIESLLGQAYEDFELIISDNASTDETPEICRRYARLDRDSVLPASGQHRQPTEPQLRRRRI